MPDVASGTKPRLTLWEALNDLGWVTGIVIGAPSILSILEMIFKGFRLTEPLQLIVDGYHRVTAVMSAIVKPVITPGITWVNATLGWHLRLYPHWRPLFLLGMVFLGAFGRLLWRDRDY